MAQHGPDAKDPKDAAARAAVSLVEDGMRVGLGTGSTADLFVRHLGDRVREGLRIEGVPTSVATMELARALDIPLIDLEDVDALDLAVDGADEVDPNLDLVKGLGGALLREKIVAAAAKRVVILVDESKLVDRLGTKAPVPVEVLRFGWLQASWKLKALGCEPAQRRAGEAAFVTDNGNYILDCRFPPISDPQALDARINAIPGVVDHGLFLGMAERAIVGRKDGTVETRIRPGLR